MDEKTATSLLNIAIKPERLPICRRVKPVTLAAGNCIAGLVAHTMKGNIGYLMNQVDICDGEIKYETKSSIGKIVEHLEIANGLHSLFCFTTVKRDVFSTDNQNIVAKAFEELPKRSLQIYYDGIDKVRTILEREIIDKAEKFVGRISNHPETNWDEDVELLFHNIRQALFRMKRCLANIMESVEEIIKEAKGDFDDNVKQVWAIRKCQQKKKS